MDEFEPQYDEIRKHVTQAEFENYLAQYESERLEIRAIQKDVGDIHKAYAVAARGGNRLARSVVLLALTEGGGEATG